MSGVLRDLVDVVRPWLQRARRVERRELREFAAWLEHTSNLVHISVLLFVPVLIAAVTVISNTGDVFPFVLFPPLASGTFTLFADPEGKYASPTKFVAGLTAGALCGTAAIWVAMHTALHDPLGTDSLRVSPVAAALTIFLTGVVTWAFDFEEPSAFSTALLALIAPVFSNSGTVGDFLLQYAGSVFVASSVVAVAFSFWRSEFYEQRERYLYRSTQGDDQVLVPMRGEDAEAAAMFGAKLAAAHDAGKVVLVDVVDDRAIAEAAETLSTEAATDTTLVDPETSELDPEEDVAEAQAADDAAERLETQAHRIRTKLGVRCEVVVAGDGSNPGQTVLRTAREMNCDLIVTPYEEYRGGLSGFVRTLFGGTVNAVAYRPAPDSEPRRRWRRVLVPVRRAGDTAHAMIDFARRLVGRGGSVGVCTCIDREGDRRSTESMLADLVEAFDGSFETRVARSDIEEFLASNDDHYDLFIIGASTDRSAASRFVAPPTFQRIGDLDCDVAVVHRP
ncbi:universal stress protein [Halomicrococcus sp. NG-SE-24]|uniref:universal stress protein n=1 Tax=Halomicrococcus sp. NG-SE-24 TaxID=3436928 RepID=UPI003D9652A6